MKKNKITSLVLAFMFAVSISPKAVAMEKEQSLIPDANLILTVPTVIMIVILVFADRPARNAMSRVSQRYSELMRRLWNDPEFTNCGLFTDRRIFHSLNLAHAMNDPVVDGDNIYLLCHMTGCHSAEGFSVVQLNSDAVPMSVPSSIVVTIMSSFLRPVVSNSLILITEANARRGLLRIIRRGERNVLKQVQNIPLPFNPGPSLSRGEYLYVLDSKGDYLNIYHREENQYEWKEKIHFGVRWMKEMILLGDQDILLAGQFGGIAVVRLIEDGHHQIVQDDLQFLPMFTSCYPAPSLHGSLIVDGEFIYASYQKGPSDIPHDFFVMRRDQKGVCQSWEAFDIGNPTSPAIMGDHIVVASQSSGWVFVFHRDKDGHHVLVQTILLENAAPSFLVPHGNALYITSAKSNTVFILYRQPDGAFLCIGEFEAPAGNFNGLLPQPVLHGDVLLLGGGTELMTLSYPNKPPKK